MACRLGNSSPLPPAEDLRRQSGRHSNTMTLDRPALITPELPNVTRLVPLERHLSAIRWQFIRGVLIGILVSSAVAIPAFKYSNIRQHRASLQNTQNTTGQTPLRNSDAQTPSRAPKSTSDIAGTSFSPPTLSKPQPSKPVNDFPPNPVEPLGAKPRPKPLVSSPGSQPAQLADLPLPEPGHTKTTLSTPQQLWSSVQAGNTKAAVALAALYMRGEGVPVNCDQARVLLVVASKDNNAEAIKKLQELDETGCPAP
jgi:cytoskeletal protein RodZ